MEIFWCEPDVIKNMALRIEQNQNVNKMCCYFSNVRFLPGFHLSGTVTEPANPLYSEPEKTYKVSISFDR